METYSSFNLNFEDPPDSLEINYANNNLTVNEGTKIRIMCVSRGGNPLPEFEWTLNGKTKLAPMSTQSIVYSVESTIDIVLKREHHGEMIQCQASNKVGQLKKFVNLKVSCKIKIKIICCFFYLIKN